MFCDLDLILTSLSSQTMLFDASAYLNYHDKHVSEHRCLSWSMQDLLWIHLLNNITSTKNNCPTIGLFPIYHSCLNSPSVQIKTVSLNTSQAIISSKRFNLPTLSTIQLSLHFLLFMTTSSKLLSFSLHLIVIFTLSFILTSFIYAIVCE